MTFIPPVEEGVQNAFDQLEEKPLVPKKPYLKRKSIRVDQALREMGEKSRKVQQSAFKKTVKPGERKNSEFEALQQEKKELEKELLIMKGKFEQLEQMYYEMRNFYTQCREPVKFTNLPSCACFKNECNKSNNETKLSKRLIKKSADSLEKCPKCNKQIKYQYMMYHQRVCGNTKVKNLLSEKDLLHLEMAKLNSTQVKYEFDWRKRRVEFKRQIQEAKKKKGFVIVCKRK